MSQLLLHLAEVDSTQAFLRRHPELGFCGVMADTQTEGRGRQGNRWESAPRAGLWLSVALPISPLPPGLLLQRAMACVIGALDSAALGLKWPNDLVAVHQGRLVKLGGLLGEVVGGRLILGVGINLTTAPSLPDRQVPPAALSEMGIAQPDSVVLARTILNAWKEMDSDFQPAFRWPEAGMPLVWEGGQGVCLGWEADGRLKVTTAGGIQRLSVGEVSALRPGAP